MDLASIVGQYEWDRFTEGFREKRRCIGADGGRDRFEGLWSDWETEAVCRFLALPEPESVRLFCEGRRVHPRLYRSQNGSVDYSALERLLSAGASLNLPRVEDYSNVVLTLTRALERSLQFAVQANLYVTPGGGRGLGAHRDPHDVLILQLRGQKCWTFENGPGGDTNAARQHSLDAMQTVTAGGWLYVPKSLHHDVRNHADEQSTHISLGFHVVTADGRWDDPPAPRAVRFTQYQTPVPPGDLPPVNAAVPDDRAWFAWRTDTTSVVRTSTALFIDVPYRRSPLAIRLEAAGLVDRMMAAGVFHPHEVTTASLSDAKLLCGLLSRVGVLRLV